MSLNTQQFARVKALFNRLVELPTEARHALDEEHDPAVVSEVQRLLAQTTSVLENALAFTALNVATLAPGSGTELGAWTLLEQIGAGGMGKVFRARRSDGHFEQIAAVKLLAGLPHLYALRHLARERQILADLVHPNIARLLDGGNTPQGQPYLVMEFIGGLPILEYCRARALAPAARLKLLLPVCSAVAFAHQRLVVHCDLKPANILVTESGQPMLLDFGISKLLTDSDSAMPRTEHADADSSSTGVSYTPRYASPEQVARDRIGTASDIFSLGLVLAELLEVPWLDGGQPALATLPDELAAIITKATQPEVIRRYASVDQLAADLRRYLEGDVVLARTPTPAYLLQKWLRRNWLRASVAALFITLLLGFSWQMRRERDSALAAERATRAVKDYIVAVFQGANPESAGQLDLPVSRFLDAGVERLAAALNDQPTTQAELAIILGGVYQSIGKRQRALQLFERGIELARQQDLPALLAEGLQRRAYTLYDMGEFAAALIPAREALAAHARLAPRSSAHLASMRLLGSILGYAGERQEAPGHLNLALELAKTTYGADSLEAALAHLDLARYYGSAGEHAAAVQEHAALAEALFVRALGASHFQVANAIEMHVLGLVQAGSVASALPLAEQLVAMRTQLYGEISHPRSYALHVQASVLRSADKQLQAILAYTASLAIHDVLDGKDAVAGLEPLFGLARAQEESGAHADAVLSFRRFLAIVEQHSAIATRSVPQIRIHLARNLRFAGQLVEAQTELDAALAQLPEATESLAADRIDALIELAALKRELGALPEAKAVLDAIKIDDPAQRVAMLAEAARIGFASGQLAAGQQNLDAALALAGTTFGDNDLRVWWLQLDRCEAMARAGQVPAARELAIRIRTRLTPGMDPKGRWAVRLNVLTSQMLK